MEHLFGVETGSGPLSIRVYVTLTLQDNYLPDPLLTIKCFVDENTQISRIEDGSLVRKKATLHKIRAQRTRWPGEAAMTGWKQPRDPLKRSIPEVSPTASWPDTCPPLVSPSTACPAGLKVPIAPEEGSRSIPWLRHSKSKLLPAELDAEGEDLCFHHHLCRVLAFFFFFSFLFTFSQTV